MKHFNQKTEAIIHTNTIPVDCDSDTKDGDIIPHKEIVISVKIYIPIYDSDGRITSHREVQILRDDLMSISLQITEIEKRRFDETYFSDLPF